MSDITDEIECRDCKGHGTRLSPGQLDDSAPCPDCNGTGWRLPTQDEYDSLAEAAYERSLDGEPPLSAQERHERDWKQKQELRR